MPEQGRTARHDHLILAQHQLLGRKPEHECLLDAANPTGADVAQKAETLERIEPLANQLVVGGRTGRPGRRRYCAATGRSGGDATEARREKLGPRLGLALMLLRRHFDHASQSATDDEFSALHEM